MNYTLFILALSFFIGCSSLSDEELWRKVEQAKANHNWDSTMQVSQRILKDFPQGHYGGWARFALAESYRFKNQPREAVDNYKLFVEKYHEMQPGALSLFLVGYIYSNDLHMNDSAKFYFELFLGKYPNHELVPSVKFELESIGKSPQEVLDEKTGQRKTFSKK